MIVHRLIGCLKNPVVLLLHCFLGHSEEWGSLIEQISSSYCCLTVDLPGHGQTELNEENNTVFKVSQQICEILDQYDIEKCHVLGYSMGGRFAVQMIQYRPDLFLSCILESSCLGIKDEEARKERIQMDDFIARQIEREADDFRGYLLKWYQQPFFRSLKKKRKIFEEMLIIRLKNNPHSVAQALRCYGTGQKPSLWNCVADISCPVFLLCGLNDEKFVAISREMLLQVQQAHMIIFSDCGHNIHMEEPQKYCEVLYNFLKNFS